MIVNHLTFTIKHMKAALEIAEPDENVVFWNDKQGTIWLSHAKKNYIFVKVIRDPEEMLWVNAGFCPACLGILNNEHVAPGRV